MTVEVDESFTDRTQERGIDTGQIFSIDEEPAETVLNLIKVRLDRWKLQERRQPTTLDDEHSNYQCPTSSSSYVLFEEFALGLGVTPLDICRQ